MSTEVFATRLKDVEPRILHLMLPREDQCLNCGASRFAMRTYFTRESQTWANIFASPGSTLSNQEDEFKFVVCKADKKEVYDGPDYAPLHPGSAE
jgi:hypothetical protein